MTAEVTDAINSNIFVRVFRCEELQQNVADNITRGDWLSALRCMGSFAAVWMELAADVAQEAYNEGATKKAMADALGVTPATFRGIERTR